MDEFLLTLRFIYGVCVNAVCVCGNAVCVCVNAVCEWMCYCLFVCVFVGECVSVFEDYVLCVCV